MKEKVGRMLISLNISRALSPTSEQSITGGNLRRSSPGRLAIAAVSELTFSVALSLNMVTSLAAKSGFSIARSSTSKGVDLAPSLYRPGPAKRST